ncbi:MAG: class I SAM-dependent methyltransferase [Candidatus Saccharimonadales bacterium]
MGDVSEMDIEHLKLIRQNVSDFIARAGKEYDKPGVLVLDVAPQDHEGAKPYFKQATVETLDIDPKSGATYIADLCADNTKTIPSDCFDYIVCTEVLEHTLQPFDAVKDMERMLKPGGLVFASSPFNFRIHGPLPDCWRFTEHGWRALFKDFEIVELKALETQDRFLAPIHYTLIAKKRAN